MVIAVLLFSESASWRSALMLFALGGAGSVACGGGCGHEAGESGASATTRPPVSTTAKVGNDDPHGVENQPDWSEMARELRVRVEPRMPKELPADPRSACTQMLDAAVTFYDSTEKSEARRTQRLAELAATREDDLGQCIEETSVSAAVCVTVLLGDRDSEYPWLLDQCNRAFPGTGRKPGAPTGG
jgi:hypothetical protein